MFRLVNKKAIISCLFSKAPFYQIRIRSIVPNKEKPIPKEGSQTRDSFTPIKSKIPISDEILEKKLGLVLKKTDPKVSSRKLTKLETQLEEITMQSVLETEIRTKAENKTLGNNIIRHSLRDSSKKIRSLMSTNRKKKRELEEQLEPVDFQVKTIEDFKESPSEILKRKYSEAEEKKFEKSKEMVRNYLQGEPGIDYLKPPPEVEDQFNSNLHYLKQGFEKITSDMLGVSYARVEMEKIKWLEKKENLEKLKQLESVKVVEYPGSPKGANPQDDPEFFLDWYEKNAPPALLDLKKQYEAMREEQEGGRNNELACEQVTLTNECLATSDVSFIEIAAQDPMESFVTNKHHMLIKSVTPVDEIAPYPEQEMLEWNENVEHVERWAIFRIFPAFHQMKEMLKANMERNEQWVVSPGSMVLPSLYRYYNTLPRFVRDDEYVKSMVRAFEFTKHNMTIKEKELSLNFVCQFSLPLDELSKEIALEAIECNKYFLTESDDEKFINDPEPKMAQDEESEDEKAKDTKEDIAKSKLEESKEKKIKNIGQQLEEEEKAKLLQKKLELKEQIKKDLKDPTIFVSWKYGMWERPPYRDPLNPADDPNPNLPLEYYDNDDGFWDDHIKEKERRYNLYPMIYHRPYFKH